DVITTAIFIQVVGKTVGTVKVKPVKTTYFIRTVVSTIFSTYTTVISHLVQAFAAVVGSRYRTNVFTRSVVAMLAHHRLEYSLYAVCIIWIAAKITVNSDPGHFLRFQYFMFPYYRNIIFCLTGNYTSRTSGTGI